MQQRINIKIQHEHQSVTSYKSCNDEVQAFLDCEDKVSFQTGVALKNSSL